MSAEKIGHTSSNTSSRTVILLLLLLQRGKREENVCLGHSSEEEKFEGSYLCWKKDCNQSFPSFVQLEKHFHEVHLSSLSSSSSNVSLDSKCSLNFVHRCRERLLSIGEDVVRHYLENVEKELNDLVCDVCSKTFSTLSTLKVHYEEIHSIRLSSAAIEHWIFLLQKLHHPSSSSSSSPSPVKKKKRPVSVDPFSSSLKKSRSFSPPLPNKRQRTRITDEQLTILREHFDCNHSPSDEELTLIGRKTTLTSKVIKHWFRNTLFKERQRNKDSPYNFSNPPTTLNQFDLDEYHKTGTIVAKASSLPQHEEQPLQFNSDWETDEEEEEEEEEESLLSHSDSTSEHEEIRRPPPPPVVATQQQSRRANRTRFTDEQLRYLQEAFEGNPYPKDDDLEVLSQKLKLNSRVIVVWFQNARQKARKSYENNQNDSPLSVPVSTTTTTTTLDPPSTLKGEKDEGYSCKNCSKLFTRFAELMKHAKQCSIPSTLPAKKKTTNKNDCRGMIPDPLPSDSSFPSFPEQHSFQMQQALLNAAAFFPLAAYHPAAAAAAMAALNSHLFPPVSLSLSLFSSL